MSLGIVDNGRPDCDDGSDEEVTLAEGNTLYNVIASVFRLFWPYIGQPHNHIILATSMPFASINATNPRTNQ